MYVVPLDALVGRTQHWFILRRDHLHFLEFEFRILLSVLAASTASATAASHHTRINDAATAKKEHAGDDDCERGDAKFEAHERDEPLLFI